MKKKFINLSIFLFGLWMGIVSFANAQTTEKSKAVVKTFSATGANSVRHVIIRTESSKVNVSSWNAPEAQIAVVVNITTDNPETARSILDKITIQYNQDGNEARATTLINGKADNLNWLRRRVQKFEIRFDVRLPSDAGLDVKNEFGTLQIDSMRGPIHTQMDYGNVNATALMNNNNIFEGNYAHYDIHFLHGGKFRTDYAKIYLDMGFYVRISGDYNTTHLQRIKKLNLVGDYNKVKAKRIKDLFALGDFLEFNIDRIYNARIRGDYNKIVLHELGRGFHNFITSGDFNHITITNPKAVAYVLQMDTENSEWKISGLKYEGESKKNAHLRTYYKKPDTQAKISIVGDYLHIEITNPSRL